MEGFTLTDIRIPFDRAVRILITWTLAGLAVGTILALPFILLWVVLVAMVLASLR